MYASYISRGICGWMGIETDEWFACGVFAVFEVGWGWCLRCDGCDVVFALGFVYALRFLMGVKIPTHLLGAHHDHRVED